MNKLSPVILNVDVRFEAPGWWRDRSHLATIFGALRRCDLWFDFVYYGRRWSKKMKGPLSADEILDASVAWKAEDYALSPDRKGSDRAPMLVLSINNVGFSLGLIFTGRPLKALRDGLLGACTDFVTQIHGELPAFIGPTANIALTHLVYPVPRPPRPHRLLGHGNVIDFASRRFHARFPSGDPEALEKMIGAEMPAGATREERNGDLFVFRWVRGVTDEGEVLRALSAREQWIARVVKPAIAANYNESGDHLIPRFALQEHPLLTFYSSTSGIGHKAIVVTREGDVDEEELREAASWLAAGRLPDGSPLERLYLIVPVREAALAIHDRASELGIAAVFYTDGHGQLWDPFPAGPWIEG